MARRPVLEEATTRGHLRRQFKDVRSSVSGDTRFSAQAIFFLTDQLARIEALLEQQLKLAQKVDVKRKRPQTAWQKFFAAGMKAGKTPTEIGAEWRNR